MTVDKCCAGILVERLDCDRDGTVSVLDAFKWLVPPRDLEELRKVIARWVSTAHEGRPRLAFDLMDVRGRGLVSRCEFGAPFANGADAPELSEPEIDVVFSSLNVEGSGGASLREFASWLAVADQDLEASDDDEHDIREDDATHGTLSSAAVCGVFASAAAQLRCALLQRAGAPTNVTTADARQRVLELVKAEFQQIDSDSSGTVSRSEFETFVRSVGVAVDTDDDESACASQSSGAGRKVRQRRRRRRSRAEWHDDGPEVVEEKTVELQTSTTTSLEALGLIVEEIVPSRHGRDRKLIVHTVKDNSPASRAGCCIRDELLFVRGTNVQELAISLDACDDLEIHPLDALTRRVDAALNVTSNLTSEEEQIVTICVRRRSARRLTTKQVEILLRAIDADNNGAISLEEIEHFVLESPEDGEPELAVAIEAARACALTLAERADDGNIGRSARAFNAIAAKATAQSPRQCHVLPATAVMRWLRSVHVAKSNSGPATKMSRRQASIILDRLDANGDGVVSRSEFDAWLHPLRSLEDTLAALNRRLDRPPFDADLYAFHAALFANADSKLALVDNFRDAKCELKPTEIDALLNAAFPNANIKLPLPKQVSLDALAKLLHRSCDTSRQHLEIDLEHSRRKMPTAHPTQHRTVRHQPSQHAVKVPETRSSILRSQAAADRQLRQAESPCSKTRIALSQSTPAELARVRELERQRRLLLVPPPSDSHCYEVPDTDIVDDVHWQITRLQAAARAVPCRSIHEALRREAAAAAEREAALIQVASLRTQIVAERTCQAKKAFELEADFVRTIAKRDATIDALRSALEEERELHRERVKDLTKQLAFVKATSSEAVLAERRRAAAHYRTRLKKNVPDPSACSAGDNSSA